LFARSCDRNICVKYKRNSKLIYSPQHSRRGDWGTKGRYGQPVPQKMNPLHNTKVRPSTKIPTFSLKEAGIGMKASKSMRVMANGLSLAGQSILEFFLSSHRIT